MKFFLSLAALVYGLGGVLITWFRTGPYYEATPRDLGNHFETIWPSRFFPVEWRAPDHDTPAKPNGSVAYFASGLALLGGLWFLYSNQRTR